MRGLARRLLPQPMGAGDRAAGQKAGLRAEGKAPGGGGAPGAPRCGEVPITEAAGPGGRQTWCCSARVPRTSEHVSLF